MRKSWERPLAAAAAVVRRRWGRINRGYGNPRSRGCRTCATPAMAARGAGAVLAMVLLVAGLGHWFKPDLIAFAQSAPPPVIPADAYLKGAWSAVHSWPLIAIHAVLLPDGRVLTYGSNNAGRHTGFFSYDVWSPEAGLAGGHMTLPNGTGTDIFCGSQLLLPLSPGVFLAGGDNWSGTGTTNTGNNNSNVFDYGENTLARGDNMNGARWYSTSTTLLNGETYIQGGSGGTDRPEIRGLDGVFRLLTGANTSTFSLRTHATS
jgi:hypothetical protein